MKKTAAAILSLLLMTGAVAGMADGAYTPGTYRQSAKGMGGDRCGGCDLRCGRDEGHRRGQPE